MLIYPNAKINLGLNIVRKRDDGFHDIETVFYPIAINDVLEFVRAESDSSFASTGIAIPGSGDNLVMKALALLQKDFSQVENLKVHLHKVIPIGAGLGGGSADAAFMLKALRDYFRLPLPNDQLKEYAAKLGSDCSFFIDNQPAYAWGRGELMEPISLWLKDYHLLLVYPNLHISTAQAYSSVKPQVPQINVRDVVQLPVDQWKDKLINDFEVSAFEIHPQLIKLKEELYNMGAEYACMSGSGSSFFGIFKEKVELSEEVKKYSNWWIAL
ncbi:MAG: 4-(cytidine 5'-diphospho)-2-C-methyl-D-erythritol kinase [Flavobacteriales bacterium]